MTDAGKIITAVLPGIGTTILSSIIIGKKLIKSEGVLSIITFINTILVFFLTLFMIVKEQIYFFVGLITLTVASVASFLATLTVYYIYVHYD